MYKGQRFILRNTSRTEVLGMNLTWFWKAGETVIYEHPVEDGSFVSLEPGRPSSMFTTTHGRDVGRKVWIYNDLIEVGCIWE